MPTIEAVDSHDVLEWSIDTFIGRNPPGLVVDGPSVSRIHAAIVWAARSRCWVVHDLGSANGTYVDGSRVEPGRSLPLARGSELVLGTMRFKVRALEPPPLMAVTSEGDLRVAEDGVLLLPEDTHPEIAIVKQDGGWLATSWPLQPDHAGHQRVLSGDTVSVAGQLWRLTAHDLQDSSATQPSLRRLQDASIIIEVPPMMENIRIALEFRDKTLRLKPRRHGELIWLLARARQSDRDRASAREAGWVDTELLHRQMGSPGNATSYLRVLVHRARSQLEKLGIVDYASIIESRQEPAAQFRLGTPNFVLIEH